MKLRSGTGNINHFEVKMHLLFDQLSPPSLAHQRMRCVAFYKLETDSKLMPAPKFIKTSCFRIIRTFKQNDFAVGIRNEIFVVRLNEITLQI